MRLAATELACVRSGREVFAGLDFTVTAGEALLVLGRNGAGKSSLLRMIAGLVRIAAGRLAFAGGDEQLTLAEQTHYLGHQDAVKPSLTVAENLEFWLRYFGGGKGSETPLAALGLETLADLPASYLSAGQKRRLSIARLIAVARPIWLLDEPTSTLDAAAQERLAVLMKKHLAAGGLILAATHNSIGLEGAKKLRLDNSAPSPLAPAAPSPVVGEERQ